ncbi:MAG: PAS domain S-box protein [Bryobacteraceae bacterium]|nr:PAS domain S-box protein [Bryobacteraceae bacterium]
MQSANAATRAVEHTYQVLNTAESLLSTVQEAEIGQRSYLLTGDARYLEPYRSALAAERPLRASLAFLVADNQSESARVREIDRVVRQRLEFLSRTAGAKGDAERAVALAIVRSGEGSRLMEHVRTLILEAEDEEQRLLVARSSAARGRALELQWTCLIGFAILAVLLLATGVSAERYLAARASAERELRESGERLRRVLDNVPDVIVLYDRDRRIQFINSSTLPVTGLTPDHFVGKREEDIWPPEICGQVVAMLEAARQTKTPQTREIDLDLPKTGQRHLLLRCVPLLDEAGAVRELVGITHDLTEWKRAHEALRLQSEQELNILQTMVAAAPVGLVMLDRKLRHVQCSQRWLDDFGLTRDQVIGKPHYDTLPNLGESWKAAHRRGLAGHGSSLRDEYFMAPDGTEHWVNREVQPWGDQGETTGGIIIYSEDITARKRAEEAVRQSELLYRGLFTHMNEGLAYCEMIFENGAPPDFLYLAVNDSFGDLTGLRDVVGKRVSEVIPGIQQTDPDLIRRYGRVASTGIPEKFETWVEALGMWFSISIYSPGNNFFVAVFDVITERKKADLSAREWRRAFEQAEIGIALVKPGVETFSAVNATFARERGYSPDDLIGKPITLVNPAERFARMREIVEQANGPAGHVAVESVHLRKDGSRFPVFLDLTGVRDEEGRLVSLVIIAQDLTEWKRAEEERHRSDALYRAIMRSLPGTGLFVVDHDLRYIAVEGDLPSLIGFPREALLGRQVGEVLEPAKAPASIARFRRTLEGASVDAENDFQGCTVWTRYVPLRDSTGSVTAAVALTIDITTRKRAEDEIRRLNEDLEARVHSRTVQLEAALKELEAFSYSVSHDLRSPLRGIDGWSLALIEDYGDSLDETAQRYLGRVRSETQRMGLLIDDLLQLSRVASAELKRERVDLSAAAHRVASRLREENPGRRIEFQIEDGLLMLGDARLLDVVLTNLFNNAVKFTGPRAEARIEFGLTETAGERAFFVRDNGVGFNMAYASSLFSAFQRLHKASEFPGTGIGLATVQRVIRRHGGRVWAEAVAGAGATFYFTAGEGDK